MAVQMLNHEKRNRRAVFRAPGAGDGYIGNPLMEKALALFNKHLPRINALIPKGGDILGNVLKGPFTAVRDNIQNELSSGALGAAVGALGGGALGAVVREAMKITGVDDSWFGPLLTLIQRESGGNPNAINNWDINAKNGDPSRGLMQTIGATFRRYKLPGLSNNIFDPLSNVVAGIRYIKARYGSIFNVQQAVGATPKGYDNGGPLPPGGLAYNASTGVEMVLNRAQGLALERRLDADDRPIELTANLHLDGKVIDQRIIRYDKNQVKDLRRGVRP
jgi:soluble lytic murein transglycosylase-like protein